jgi:hypothetical protein
VLAGTDVDPIESMLDNFSYPRRIWQHIVDYDLNDGDVAVLELIFCNGFKRRCMPWKTPGTIMFALTRSSAATSHSRSLRCARAEGK